MARGRSPGYDDQREMILRHAAELFARRGYPATSMNEVAEACGLSKPTIYHYFRDKYNLLVHIADGHVSRLHALVEEVEGQHLEPEARLRELIHRFVEEYAEAHHAHRVLTEDVRFLQPEDSERILGKERAVVAVFARAVAQMRPDTEAAGLAKALTMLLFGMVCAGLCSGAAMRSCAACARPNSRWRKGRCDCAWRDRKPCRPCDGPMRGTCAPHSALVLRRPFWVCVPRHGPNWNPAGRPACCWRQKN